MARSPSSAKRGVRTYLGDGIFVRTRKSGADQYGIAYTDPNGKRVREIVGPTKTLAKTVLAVRRAEIAEGRYNFPTRKQLKFSEFAKDYLAWAKQRKTSWRRDAGIVNKLVAFFGDKRMDQISTFLVNGYKVESMKTVKKATVNRELAILRGMYNLAIAWNKAQVNPVRSGRENRVMFEEDERPIYALTAAEQQALLAACSPHLFPIVALALNTGLRKGELLALTWQDVDLVRGAVTVRRSKSGKIRTVPLNAAALEALRGIEGPRQGEVFRFKGEPIKDNVNRSFARARRAAGLERVVVDELGHRSFWPRFHDCRHSFATDLVLAGVDLVTVKELLGHSDLSMVLRYSHPTPDSKRRAVDALLRPNCAQQPVLTTEALADTSA